MADNDVVGHVRTLVQMCESPPGHEFWREADCQLLAFADLDLEDDCTDLRVWRACQEHGIVLITGNRNAKGPESLEMALRKYNDPQCLPVVTLADQDRIMRDRAYAAAVVEALLGILFCDGTLGQGGICLRPTRSRNRLGGG